MDMNTSLYFKNLTDEELLQILNVISVPCLMEPLKKQAHRYFGKSHKGQSLSREAVNHIYLKFLKAGDLVLSLYLSDLVVDIIHFFKLSDGFKRLLTTDDPAYPEKLAKKIKKRHCPISVDMFMRLLDAHYEKQEDKVAYDIEIEEMTEKTPEEDVIDEEVLTETLGTMPQEVTMHEADAFENSDFFDVLPEVNMDDEQTVVEADSSEVLENEDSIEIPTLNLDSQVEVVDSFEENQISPELVAETSEAEVVNEEHVVPMQEDSTNRETEETQVVDVPEIVEEQSTLDVDTAHTDELQPEVVENQNEETMSSLQENTVVEESHTQLDDMESVHEEEASQESTPVVFEEKNEDALIVDDQKIAQLEKEISGLQYQIMTLQMENESLKDENRDLLFQGEDESEKESLKQDIDSLEADNAHLKEDMANLTNRNQELEKELADFQTAKENENQMRLELREFKIKYISLQSEYDQLQYKLKNDNKRLKELENKQRTIHESKEDLMLALHDLNWYKKQWHLPGDAPIHQIWSHLNNVESQKLKDLMKKYDRMVKSEKQEQVEGLKEILLVKEAILILLKANRQVKNKNEDTTAPF